jgi:predicted acetyltransferase
MPVDLQPGPVAPDEFEAFAGAVAHGFHDEMTPEDLERIRPVHEHERALAIREGGRIVATTSLATFEVTVPGGPVPMAGVTAVTVSPTHRRRGLLTALMRAQLDGLRDGGEAVAGLWASEARIYGRFGYGPATREGTLVVRSDRAALRPELRVPDAVVETLAPSAALESLRAVHDAVRPRRSGMLSRNDGRWMRAVADPESERHGAKPLRAAVLRDAGGAPRGYALYAVRSGHDRGEPAFEAIVREVLADGPRATAAMWQYLLGLDLVRTLSWEAAPADCEVGHLVDNPRVVRTDPGDALWIRLVDVDRALAARTYAAEVDLVLEVQDPFCPWNAGRHRLGAGASGATCTPTSAPADLRLDVEALGAVYLGGPSLRALADAGRVEELTPGAVDAGTTAFRGEREPWCPEGF